MKTDKKPTYTTRARSLAEVRVRTARGGVAVHHQPLCLMRVEAS